MTRKITSPWLRGYVQKREDRGHATSSAAVDVDLTNGETVAKEVKDGNDTDETTSVGAGLSGDPNANNPVETTGEDAGGEAPADATVISEDVTEVDTSVEDQIPDVIGSGDPNAHTPEAEAPEAERPWDNARTHADIDETVPVGADLPEEWKTLTLAEKRQWLDENIGA